MKPLRLIATVLSCLALLACGSSATVNKSWVDEDFHEKNLHGVLVVAIASRADSRMNFERDFAAALSKRGVRAVASYTLKPGVEIDKADVNAMGKQENLDTVLVTTFAGRDENEVLHPGRKYYAYQPIYVRDYYGRGTVYGVPYQVGQTPDFWAQHKSVHLEANLYAIATEEHLWRAASGMEETSDVPAMQKAFVDSFMKDLTEQKLVD